MATRSLRYWLLVMGEMAKAKAKTMAKTMAITLGRIRAAAELSVIIAMLFKESLAMC